MRKPLVPSHKLFTLFMVICFIGLLFTVKTKAGLTTTKSTPETRALELGKKECYTNQDIEYIVFGQIQE